MTTRFGIIGCGLIGKKRAASLQRGGAPLSQVFDLDPAKARAMADTFPCSIASSPTHLIISREIDAVIIATSNDVATPLAIQAMKQGKNVFLEKPAGRNPSELTELVRVARETKQVCRIGFNHRFHPGLQKAKALLSQNAIGDLLYFRARYGHGGRKGYDREWRADPKRSGGGELLDQGVHLIDLCRWLGGEFQLEIGRAQTKYWDMPVEDNGFLLLNSPDGKRSAWLHASCTEWKNIFDFEIFGSEGKIQILGLGGSYGREQLHHYRRHPISGPPELITHEFSEEDLSWDKELAAFYDELCGESTDLGRPEDALRAMEIVYDCYRQSGKIPVTT